MTKIAGRDISTDLTPEEARELEAAEQMPPVFDSDCPEMTGAQLHEFKQCNRVIFLDVDGVLNNGAWAMEMFKQGMRVYRDDLLYEPSLVQLRRIVDETGAVIVVSSAWRQIPTAYGHLKDWLEKFGMAVYDKTPYVGSVRGDDITAWFNRHPGNYRYVILDDDDDMDGHMEHLVQTDFDEGLTAEKADECIRRLRG